MAVDAWHFLHINLRTPPASCNGSFYMPVAWHATVQDHSSFSEMLADLPNCAALRDYLVPVDNPGVIVTDNTCRYKTLEEFPEALSFKEISFKGNPNDVGPEYTQINSVNSVVLGVVGEHAATSHAWDSANLFTVLPPSAAVPQPFGAAFGSVEFRGVGPVIYAKKTANGITFTTDSGKQLYYMRYWSGTQWSANIGTAWLNPGVASGTILTIGSDTWKAEGEYCANVTHHFSGAPYIPYGILPLDWEFTYTGINGAHLEPRAPMPLWGNLGKSDYSIFPPNYGPLTIRPYLSLINGWNAERAAKFPRGAFKYVNIAKHSNAANYTEGVQEVLADWYFSDGANPQRHSVHLHSSPLLTTLAAAPGTMQRVIEIAYEHRKDSRTAAVIGWYGQAVGTP